MNLLPPPFNIHSFDIEKYDQILNRGLIQGLGQPYTQMCIEAAICLTLGLPHGDDPQCVTDSVRRYKIGMNDLHWSSCEARAKGLRNLGLAQLGSLGVVENIAFAKRLAKLHIEIFAPTLLQEMFQNTDLQSVRARTPPEVSVLKSIISLHEYDGRSPIGIVDVVFLAQNAIRSSEIASDENIDKYLILSTKLALQVLRELNSPGCSLLDA